MSGKVFAINEVIMSYNPGACVQAFIGKYGFQGLMVLSVFNEVDPYKCFYGDDVNPDEYVGVATKYLEYYQHDPTKGIDLVFSGERKGYPIEPAARELLIELLSIMTNNHKMAASKRR